MGFNSFLNLTEGQMANKASLIMQAFIDNIGSSHYKKDDDSITFNVGRTIKISKYSNLRLIVRERDSENIRLGKSNDGSFAIVVDTESLPDITNMDEFLEGNKVMPQVVDCIEKYIEYKKSHKINDDEDVSKMTKYEKDKHYNSKEAFEETYQKLIQALNEKIEQFEQMSKNFKEQIEKTQNPSRKVTLELAIDKLKNDYIGKSDKDFMSMAYKELDKISPDFKNSLDKDNKKILEDRLKQFYEEIT